MKCLLLVICRWFAYKIILSETAIIMWNHNLKHCVVQYDFPSLVGGQEIFCVSAQRLIANDLLQKKKKNKGIR